MAAPSLQSPPAAPEGIGLATSLPVDDRQMSALPMGTGPWPPPKFDPVAFQHKIWDAWWTGDRQKLAWVYFNLGANSPSGRAFFSTTGEKGMPTPRPGQYRGGLLGSVEYSFWGDPTPPGEKRTKLHVPIAGDIAQTSASLLFAKPPELKTTLPGAAGIANQAWLDDLIDDGFHARLLEAGEMCSALGAVYLRIVWDTTVSDKPWIQAVPVDVAVPQFSYDKLKSVTFWQVVADDGTDVTRHLEMHVPQSSQIQHGLYQGDQTDLGEVVPLGAHPSTEALGASLPGGVLSLPDLPFDASTVVYVPNIRPNKIWRDLGPEFWPLGRSDYQGVEPLMDALDAVYSSWMRDVDLAVMRLIVPPEYLDNIGRGQGAVFEPDRRVFTPLNMLHDGGGAPAITANQFQIRWQEHSSTCQDLVTRIIQESGFSPQSFGDYDRSGSGGAVTATEIEARERVSMRTRQKKITYWRPGLQDIIYSLMCVARLYFGASAITPERPDINFAAVALPDEAALARGDGAPVVDRGRGPGRGGGDPLRDRPGAGRARPHRAGPAARNHPPGSGAGPGGRRPGPARAGRGRGPGEGRAGRRLVMAAGKPKPRPSTPAPKGSYALPGGGPGGSDAYPIKNQGQAVSALARVAENGTPAQKAKVRAAVAAKYPGLPSSSGQGGSQAARARRPAKGGK
jgi:A118 family predicted phage portal protein